MNLTEIDPDEEVQGEIHLQISVLGDADIPRKLCCQVLEARWGTVRISDRNMLFVCFRASLMIGISILSIDGREL